MIAVSVSLRYPHLLWDTEGSYLLNDLATFVKKKATSEKCRIERVSSFRMLLLGLTYKITIQDRLTQRGAFPFILNESIISISVRTTALGRRIESPTIGQISHC